MSFNTLSPTAEALLLRALEIREHILGSEYPDTVLVLYNLTLCWWKQQRSEKAKKGLQAVQPKGRDASPGIKLNQCKSPLLINKQYVSWRVQANNCG